MKIDRNNYEVIIIDYFDGKLSAAETAGLMAFLNQNPDLKSEFESFENIKMHPADDISFAKKNDLKKNIVSEGPFITEENFEEVFFEDVEGNLDLGSEKKVRRFLKNNPTLQRDYALLKKTKLSPEPLEFPNKAALKRTAVIPIARNMIYWSSAAAAAALLIVAGILLNGKKEEIFERPIALENSGNWNIRKPVLNSDILVKKNVDTQNSYYAQGTQKPEKTDVQDKKAESTTLNIMNSSPQLAYIPSAGSSELKFNEGYQTSALELLAAMDMRQKMQQQPTQNSEDKTLVQRVWSGLRKASKKDNGGSADDRFTIWNLAEVGVAGYNALAKNDVAMNRETNEEGKTTSFELGNIGYSRKK